MADAALTNEQLLTPRQRKLLGFTLGLFALVASGALLIGILVVFGKLVGHFSGVLWPLAVAGILALILRPIVDRLQLRFRGRRVAAVVVLYIVFVLLMAGLLITIIPPIIAQILDFVAYIPTLWSNAVAYVREHYPVWIQLFERMMENSAIRTSVEGIQQQASKVPLIVIPSLKAIGDGLLGTVAFVTQLAVVPIYLFFFLLSRRNPSHQLPDHLPFLSASVRSDVVFLVRQFEAIVTSFFRGQMLIGLIMGVLMAVGFTIIGLRFGLFLGLAFGILNIVPYLGTIIGLAIALPLAFFQPEGGFQLVLWVLVVQALVQIVEGYYLTPKIMGDRTGLHQITIIFAIFFWGELFDGVLGMILAIPLTAFFVTAWRLLKWKYLTPAIAAPVPAPTSPHAAA